MATTHDATAVPAHADGAPVHDGAAPARDEAVPVLDLEVPTAPTGPQVAALLRRTAIGASAGAALALTGLARARTRGGKALALGALAPGAGYLYAGKPARFLATVPAFGASLAAWFGTGNIVAPPAVWAAAAIGARRQANRAPRVHRSAEVLVPAAVAGAVVAGAVARRRAFAAAQERGRRRAAYLRTLPPRPHPRPGEPAELTAEDLAVQRSLLDLGLQPVDGLAGFDRIDQFQTSAMRYQCNFTQWALAMAQRHHTPAFQGYVAAAQRNLIEKLTLPAVWGYWRWEQLWGNFSSDFDPMRKDNIMLSGYLGTMLGVYDANTGDERYRRPGALVFRLGRRAWPYDTGTIADAVHRNMSASPLCLYACEPNWVYSGCNMTGVNTLLLADRLLGTAHADDVLDRFRQAMLEEFVTADGRITAIRSSRSGFTIPSLTSTMADCGSLAMLNPSMPDLARRTWEIARHELVDVDASGEPRVEMRGWDRIDTGNYRRGEVGVLTAVMWAAAEMGDRELYGALERSLERQYPMVERDGARRRDGASTNMNAMGALARFSPPGGYRALVCEGPDDAVRQGPYLDGAAYPDVLVARATTDGRDLDLVLRPGAGAKRVTLGVRRLRPGATYEARGAVSASVTADGDGRAEVLVDLDGRTVVRLAPVSA